MKKKFVDNNCQLCNYSIKEYLQIKDKYLFIKVRSCTRSDLSKKEKRQRIKNKIECSNFKLAKTSKEEKIQNIKEILNDMNDQLKIVEQLLKQEL